MIRLFALLLACGVLQTPVWARQESRTTRPPSVTASGEALVAVEPDQAEINIGVLTQSRTAPEAAKENAEKLARVIARVKDLLGNEDEVKTAGYSLNPNYRYPREGGKPEITGYTAINTVRVRMRNLDRVGRVIDAAMQAGANTINRLAFTLKDEQAAVLQALRLAAQKARAKADEMAGALGLKVLRVLSVVEGERGVRPVLPQTRTLQMEAASDATPTPIETGTIEIRSSVILTAEIGPG